MEEAKISDVRSTRPLELLSFEVLNPGAVGLPAKAWTHHDGGHEESSKGIFGAPELQGPRLLFVGIPFRLHL